MMNCRLVLLVLPFYVGRRRRSRPAFEAVDSSVWSLPDSVLYEVAELLDFWHIAWNLSRVLSRLLQFTQLVQSKARLYITLQD